MKELTTIQRDLKCNKGRENKFGGYKYRSCEDIMEAAKPLMAQEGCTLTVADEVVEVGGRIYIKATATLTNSNGEQVTTTAYAREEETKKGMDCAQITGSASSYARKYALNGLFCIDDAQDPDTMDNRDMGKKKKVNEDPFEIEMRANACQDVKSLTALYMSLSPEMQTMLNPVFKECKQKLQGGNK